MSCNTDELVVSNSDKVVQLVQNGIDPVTDIVYNDKNQITNVLIGGISFNKYFLSFIEDKLTSLIFMRGMDIWKDITFFYENEILIRAEHDPNSSPMYPIKVITNYFYNQNNQIILKEDSISGYPIDSEPWTVTSTIFEYDTVGNLIKSTKSDSTGLILEEVTYQYDKKNNPFYKKFFVFTEGIIIDFSLITSPNNITRINSSVLGSIEISYEYDDFNFPLKSFPITHGIDFIEFKYEQ